MSAVNKDGYGPVKEQDLTKLMNSLGLCVKHSKTTKYLYKFDFTYLKNFQRTLLDPADPSTFPELQGENRKRFFSKFLPRITQSCKLVII